MSLRVEVELVSGDRIPNDSWRVTLYDGNNWLMFREFFTGPNGENESAVKKEAKNIFYRIQELMAIKRIGPCEWCGHE